jgi:DNA-binding transcriptional MerR regulator
VERLTFIRRCREFDFPLEQVRALVALLHDAHHGDRADVSFPERTNAV